MKRPSDLGRSFSCWTEPRGGIGDSGRGPHVGHQMFAVSGQRDQAVRAAGSHEDHGDGAVDGGPDHRNASPTPTFSNGSGLRKRTTEVHRMNAAATKIMMPSIAAEVLGLVADGQSNAQIANTLAVSGKTVANYVSALLSSLHARDRTHLAELVNTRRPSPPRASPTSGDART